VKSLGHVLKVAVTCTNKQALLLSPIFLPLVCNELHNVYVGIATHFLAFFTVCKFAFVI